MQSGGSVAEIYPLLREVLSQSQREALLKHSCSPFTNGMEDPYIKLLKQAFASARLEEPLAQVSYAESRT